MIKTYSNIFEDGTWKHKLD
jgi:hypothetical protein